MLLYFSIYKYEGKSINLKTKINNAIDLCKNFINELFINRSENNYISYLDENIIVSGFDNGNNGYGIKDLNKIKDSNLSINKESYTFEFTNSKGFEISRNIYNIIIFINDFTNSSLNHTVELSLSFIVEYLNDSFIIKSINVSILNKIIKENTIRHSINGFIEFGGTLEYSLTDNFRIIDLSDDLLIISGYKDKHKLLERFDNSVIKAIPERERNFVVDQIYEGLSTKNHYRITHSIMRFDNTLMRVTHEGKLNRNSNGDINVIAFIIKADISAPIYNSQVNQIEKLESIINSYPAPIFYKDIDGRYTGLNRAFLNYFNLNNYFDVIGKTDFEIFDKQLAEDIAKEDQKALKSKDIFCKIYKSLNKKNKIQYSQFIKIPLKEKGKNIGLIGYVNDLTKIQTLNTQLRDNESEMEFVFNNTNSGYYIKDSELRFKRVNSAFLNFFELKESDVIGKKSSEIKSLPVSIRNREELEKNISKTRIPTNQTIITYDPKHNKKYLSFYENVLLDNNNEVSGIICAIEDISESKKKEIELQEKYDKTINNISTENFYAYFKLDINEKKIIELNSSQRFLTSMEIYNFNTIKEIFSNQLLYNDEQKEFNEFFTFENFKEISERANIPPLVYTFRGYERTVTVLRISFNCLINPQSGHLEFVILAKDITEEVNLRTLVNAITSSEYDFIAKANIRLNLCSFIKIDTAINDFNFPIENDRMSIKEFVDILLEDTIETEKVKEAMNAISYKKYAANSENRFYIDLKKGKRKNLIIKEIDREKGIFFILCADITSITRKSEAIKNKLAESMQKAQEANSIKSKFLASMSHDMRTPLNGIIGLASFGIEESKNPVLTDYFSKIKISSFFLLTLLNDVLDLQSIELGKIKIKEIAMDMDKILNEIVSMVKSRAVEKNLEFNIIKCDNYPKYVLTDPIRFNQVLINLLSNAIKYTQKKGKVDFIINYREEAVPYFEFIVKDNGFGMSEEFQSHMFEQFSTELNQYSSTEGGTGLGLAIAKNITELLGGTIECKSKLNVGTKFTVKTTIKGYPQH